MALTERSSFHQCFLADTSSVSVLNSQPERWKNDLRFGFAKSSSSFFAQRTPSWIEINPQRCKNILLHAVFRPQLLPKSLLLLCYSISSLSPHAVSAHPLGHIPSSVLLLITFVLYPLSSKLPPLFTVFIGGLLTRVKLSPAATCCSRALSPFRCPTTSCRPSHFQGDWNVGEF